MVASDSPWQHVMNNTCRGWVREPQRGWWEEADRRSETAERSSRSAGGIKPLSGDKQQSQATWGKHPPSMQKKEKKSLVCWHMQTHRTRKKIYAHNECNTRCKNTLQCNLIREASAQVQQQSAHFDVCTRRWLFFICGGRGERVQRVPWPKNTQLIWVRYQGLPYILLRHVCLSLFRPITALRGKTNKTHMHTHT